MRKTADEQNLLQCAKIELRKFKIPAKFGILVLAWGSTCQKQEAKMSAKIIRLRSDIAFDPEVTGAIGSAFDRLTYDFKCRGLGKPAGLEKHIVELAREGVIDPDDIRAACLAAHFGPNRKRA